MCIKGKKNMDEKILVMNDLPGYGKVALAASEPILSHFGYHVYNLPTALVSNTLNYGKFQILDTTKYMQGAVAVWEELGFTFDAVMTGFILSAKQLAFVKEYCKKQAKKGAKIIVDPIMGDYGSLYNGVSESTVEQMRKLCSIADYVVPNFTEAAFLAGQYENQETVYEEQVWELIDKLKEQGAGSVVITSVPWEKGPAVAGYDGEKGERFFLPYEYIPVRFPGTGDIFSSLMTVKLLQGEGLKESIMYTMKQLKKLLKVNVEYLEQHRELSLELLFREDE